MANNFTKLSEQDERKIKKLLVGRKIVEAERGEFKLPQETYYSTAEGRLILDDGTKILIRPNEGCGGCSSGWYEVEHLTKVDNVITNVELVEEVDGGEDVYEPDRSYRIFVITENERINAVQVDGNDGNGYYGTGYYLYVFPPKKDEQ